jgi:hypothetical protein
LVLTALHVVAVENTEPPQFYPGSITVTFFFHGESGKPSFATEAKPIDKLWNRIDDWIILKCEKCPPAIEPLHLVPSVAEQSSWRTHGFPDDKPDQFDADGDVTANSGAVDGARAIQLHCKQATGGLQGSGLSGAPVVVARPVPDLQPELVVVGLIRWAPKDGHTIVGQALFACPMDSILRQCRGILNDFDSKWHRLRRWSFRVLPRLGYRLFVIFKNLYLWIVSIGGIFAVPLIITYWPEEWAWRLRVDTAEKECSVDFALTDKEFDLGSPLGKTSPDDLAEQLLKIWKVWTTAGVEPNTYLVARLPKAFDWWYDSFDANVEVQLNTDGNEWKDATIQTAAAFLVKESADITHGKGLSRFRQQLVFVDWAEEDKAKKRPPIIHFSPPNKGERLLLLLRVVTEPSLPAEASKYRVRLMKTKGP